MNIAWIRSDTTARHRSRLCQLIRAALVRSVVDTRIGTPGRAR